MSSKNWVFTLNNYTSENENEVFALGLDPTIRWVCVGREVGVSGTPHFQGALVFVEKIRMPKAFFGGSAHWEMMGQSPLVNRNYCIKDGDYFESGVIPKERTAAGESEKTRWDLALECAVEGRWADIPSDIRIRHESNLQLIAMKGSRRDFVVASHTLRPWQEALNIKLNRPLCSRSVEFIVDRSGNMGKTWFAQYYCNLHSNAQYLKMGKGADMALMLREDIRVLFIDCVRTRTEMLNYEFIEAVKDGCVLSGKYQSMMKQLVGGTCHVVVLMNEEPSLSALSRDRYIITNL